MYELSLYTLTANDSFILLSVFGKVVCVKKTSPHKFTTNSEQTLIEKSTLSLSLQHNRLTQSLTSVLQV